LFSKKFYNYGTKFPPKSPFGYGQSGATCCAQQSFFFLQTNLYGRFAHADDDVDIVGGDWAGDGGETDKDDYSPGMYVIITGTGWQAGETVSFHFDEEPKPSTCVNPHDLTAVADANGNIYNDQFLVKENHLGVTFTLTATGQSSGLVATTVFTDAGIGNVTPSTFALCPGSTFNVGVQKTAAGGGAFAAGATFIVELSDANGNFGSPIVIGSLLDNAGGNGTIQVPCTIPLTVVYGTQYRVQARSTNPVTNTAINTNNQQNRITISTSDIFESFAILNFGGSNVYYDLKATTGNVDFNGANLGSFNSNTISATKRCRKQDI
jgi:hypothetical protein